MLAASRDENDLDLEFLYVCIGWKMEPNNDASKFHKVSFISLPSSALARRLQGVDLLRFNAKISLISRVIKVNQKLFIVHVRTQQKDSFAVDSAYSGHLDTSLELPLSIDQCKLWA